MGGSRVQYFKPTGIDGLEILTCCDVGYHFQPHFHDSYCIWLNASNAENYTYRGNSGILQAGDLGIIAPGEVHSNRPVDESSRQLLTYYLDVDQLQKVASEVQGKDTSAVEFLTDFHSDAEMTAGLIALQQILRFSESSLKRQTAFYEILARLVKRYATSVTQETKTGKEQQRIAKIIEQFHARIDEDIQLDELAESIDCTPYYLIRFFKKAIGLTPHAYLVQLRLEKARELMHQGQSLVTTAIDSGFTDQSHLTRHFKLKFGITPAVYRRQILNT